MAKSNICFSLFRKEERPPDLHTIPNFGIRKRVPFQQIFDQAKKDRNSSRPLFNRETD